MRERLRGRLELVLAVGFTLGMIWAIARVPYLPSNDGPQHSFVAYVRNHLDDPGAGWSDRYEPNDPPTANGYVQIVRALEPHVGLDGAHQTFICLTLGLYAWGWFTFLRRQLGAGTFIPLIAFGAAFQWTLWIGLYPFFLASTMTPFLLAVVLPTAERRPRPVVLLVVAVALVLQAWLHSFAAVLTGLLWVALRLVRGATVREVAQIAAVGLPSALYVVDFSRDTRMLSEAQGTYWDFSYDPFEILLEFFLPGPTLHGVLLLGLAAAAAVGRPQRPVYAVGLLLVAAGTLLPATWSGWELVRPRLVAPGYLLMFAGFAGAPLLLQRVAAVAVGVFVIARITWAGAFHQTLHEELAPLRAAVEGLRLEGRTWVYLQTAGPHDSPIFQVEAGSTAFHLAQQLAPAIGGEPYYSQTADRSIHQLIRKRPESLRWLGSRPRPTDFHSAWLEGAPRPRELHIATRLAAMDFVDDVVIAGLPGDGEIMAQLGYGVRLHRRDETTGLSTFVGSRGEGCSWIVHVDGPPRDAVLYVGFGAALEARDAHLVRGGTTLQLDGMPCGPNWLSADVGCVEDRQPADVVPVMPADGAIEVWCTLRDDRDGATATP